MKITIGIIARNEAKGIEATIEALSRQSLLKRGNAFDVVVVANGCSDDTVVVSRAAFAACFNNSHVTSRVHETDKAGKSRSWNLLIHEVADQATDIYVLLDADITFANGDALSTVIDTLVATPRAIVCSGWGLKDIANKPKKSLIDKLSLRISADGEMLNSISGGLYAGRGPELRQIWLPEPTPGEDGFLNAMVHTNRFLDAPDIHRVCRAPSVTHFFEAHSVTGYVKHETRMMVGTAINRWLFEHFMALGHSVDAGRMIQQYNQDRPGWVNHIVRERVKASGKLAIPLAIPMRRLYLPTGTSFAKALLIYPPAVLATAFNLVPYVKANSVLTQKDAAGFW